jgi:hypothetical protein
MFAVRTGIHRMIFAVRTVEFVLLDFVRRVRRHFTRINPPFPFRVRWREHKILIDDVVDGSMLLFLVPIATIDDEGLGVNPVSQ